MSVDLTERERQIFKELVKRDWKILSKLRCEVPGCFNEITSRIGWDEHLFDDVYMCETHFEKFLSFFNWNKYQDQKLNGTNLDKDTSWENGEEP